MMQWLEGLPKNGRHYYTKAPNGGGGSVFLHADGRWSWETYPGSDWIVMEMDGDCGWAKTKEEAQQDVECWLKEHGEKI